MSNKRKLIDELIQGVDAMRAHREGKITLRTHTVQDLPPLSIDAGIIRETREQLNVSRAVFARHIRVSIRTLENWEQGRAKPNTQAAALIMLVRRYPDTLQNSILWLRPDNSGASPYASRQLITDVTASRFSPESNWLLSGQALFSESRRVLNTVPRFQLPDTRAR